MRPNPRIFSLLLLALGLAVACKSTPPTPKAVPANPEGSAADEQDPAREAEPAAASDTLTPMTGVLTEEGFKALHELRTEDAPAAKGSTVDLEGASAYLSLPEGSPKAGLLVIHEWWVLNQHIQHWADRLAADGYAALAVDLYGGKTAETPDQAMELMKAVDGERARAILQAAHGFLQQDPRIQAQRTGVIGWCFGGAWSLQSALAMPELDAAVIYYGRLETDPQKLRAIRAPILGVFAENDQGIPLDTVKQFDAALDTAEVDHSIHTYAAEHAFANPSSGRYDEGAAADAWSKVRAFLAERLMEAGAAP
jgi:carboxymethylenebutenolidase